MEFTARIAACANAAKVVLAVDDEAYALGAAHLEAIAARLKKSGSRFLDQGLACGHARLIRRRTVPL